MDILEAGCWSIAGVLAVFLVFFFTVIWEWSSPRVYWKLLGVQSLGKIPLIGDTLFLASKKPEELLEIFQDVQSELRVRHVRALLLGIPSIMIYHPDDIEILLGNMNNIKKGYEYFSLKPWLREGLLVSDGEKWKSRRKLLTPTFHFQILEGNVRQVFQHSSTFASRLVEAKQPLEDLVRSYTLDVICETAMGVKLNAQENKADSYVRAIRRASRTIMERILKLWLKKEWLFKLTEMGKQFEEDLNVLHGFTEKVIEERRSEKTQEKTISEKKGKRKAFLDILIEEHEENSGTLTALDIREEVDTFMFEGHDTTSAAICFALYCLANHPEVQEQVYEEQKRIFGTEEREPTLADLQEMNYLETVIKEVLRLYPPVPFISRMLSKDTTFGGVEVAAGTHVSLLPYLVHRHPDFWDDPDEFKPERFEPGTTRHPYSYIPFSAGPRNCIGMKFAMLELKTTLSTIVRNCHLEPISTSLKLRPIIILKTIDPIKIRITPRKILNK